MILGKQAKTDNENSDKYKIFLEAKNMQELSTYCMLISCDNLHLFTIH